MRRYRTMGVFIGVVLLCLLNVAPAAAQARVIPFTVIEIECTEVAGVVVEENGVTHSQDQVDTAVWFSAEPLLNGQLRNVLSWDYYETPDVGLYGGQTVYTPDEGAGTFENSFSGYWDAEGGSFSATGFGTGEFAGMQINVSGGGGMDLDSALAIAKGDPRIVDGNPCYPGPMPTHGEAAFLYGQLIDNRILDVTNKEISRRYLEAWEQADLAVLDELFSEDFVNHSPPLPPDREGMKEFAAEHRRDVPTGEYTIHQIVAEGDLVFIYGYFQGEDAESSFFWSTLLRFEDGKIVERWGT